MERGLKEKIKTWTIVGFLAPLLFVAVILGTVIGEMQVATCWLYRNKKPYRGKEKYSALISGALIGFTTFAESKLSDGRRAIEDN